MNTTSFKLVEYLLHFDPRPEIWYPILRDLANKLDRQERKELMRREWLVVNSKKLYSLIPDV